MMKKESAMLRNWFRFMSTLAVAVLFACVAGSNWFHIAPHVQNITKDGVTIIWETKEEGVGTVAYGLEGEYNQTASVKVTAKIHRVRISGLKPETDYSYRVRAGNDVRTASFKTAPSTEREVTFILIGDTRNWGNQTTVDAERGPGVWEETNMQAHALQWNPEFFINSGDLIRRGHIYEYWPNHFQRFESLLAQYWMATTRGNHEGSMVEGVENDWYAKYHDLPGDGEPYASFDWGNTHVVLISYELLRDDAAEKTAAWLDEHLSKVNKRHIVVMQHDPIYCTGYHVIDEVNKRKEPGEDLASLANVLNKHNVRVNVSGHTHIYERSHLIRGHKRVHEGGTMYIVNGGGIRANYPDWWTAVKDDMETMRPPTYTVFFARDDQLEFRTFAWSLVDEKVIEIDRVILWEDEALPEGILATLPHKQGKDLIDTIEKLGALLYEPAAKDLLAYIEPGNEAEVRRAAAKALRYIGTASVSGDLAAYFDDPDLTVRREVAGALEIAMQPALAPRAAQHASDPKQDDRVRVALLGAVQLHGDDQLTHNTSLTLLQSNASEQVRQRAAYAFGTVGHKADLQTVAKMFEVESDQHVMMHLAWVMQQLTGKPDADLDDEFEHEGQRLAGSKPGERGAFTKFWLSRQ